MGDLGILLKGCWLSGGGCHIGGCHIGHCLKQSRCLNNNWKKKKRSQNAETDFYIPSIKFHTGVFVGTSSANKIIASLFSEFFQKIREGIQRLAILPEKQGLSADAEGWEGGGTFMSRSKTVAVLDSVMPRATNTAHRPGKEENVPDGLSR